MSERHKTLREPPKNQRPPRGKGWSRRSDVLVDATVWRLWAPASDGRILQMQVAITDLEIAVAGRWTAAKRLRKARQALRQALEA